MKPWAIITCVVVTLFLVGGVIVGLNVISARKAETRRVFETARQEGYADGMRGVPIEKCPYPSGDLRHSGWLAGRGEALADKLDSDLRRIEKRMRK